MTHLQRALESVAFAALVGGLTQAETINVAQAFNLPGDEGALINAIYALVVAYLYKWAHAELDKVDG